jgi:dUTP pyrophosphatase
MKIYRMNEEIELPEYATEGSAAFDIKAYFKRGDRLQAYNNWNKAVQIAVKGVGKEEHCFQLPPDTRVLVPTGLIFDIPEKHVMKMFIRSSVALKKGLSLANGTGIIDSDYVDPTYIMLLNETDSLVSITSGERLVQCIVEKVNKIKLTETKTAPEQKTDRDGGFGSTGE